jgi:hypothetical protein
MKTRLACALAALAAAAAVLGLLAAPGHAATPAPRLLAMYQPVTEFDPLEHFLPTSVQSFIADADLEQMTAPSTWTIVDAEPESGSLPGPGSGVWRLNQDSCSPAASLGGLTCYAPAWEEGHGAPTVYGRLVREGDRIVLQYWYFYYDDVYSYQYPPSNFIWQAHEGDWEVVNVVLSEDEQPISVAYSQHCLGQRRAWADTPRVDDTHPVVHVAIGSHANYFSAGVHPIDLACVPPAALAILAQLHLPAPADFAFEGGSVEGPPGAEGAVAPIHLIGDDHPSWVDFPGFWGELQYFHGPGAIGTVPFGTSPQGPAYHDVWTDPLGTLAGWPLG